MNLIVGILSAAVLVASSAGPVLAADSMHSAMMMPKCSSGDPVVSVDMKTKMYMSSDKNHMMMSGSHNGSEMSHNGMMKSDMKMMCKSKADAMGAHMMKGKKQM